MRLIYVDLATVLSLRQFSHIYQQLYHTFYCQPRHHQEDIDRDGRSIHLGQEEEGAEADYLKEEQAAVEVVEEAMEDKAKEIKIKVKIGLT